MAGPDRGEQNEPWVDVEAGLVADPQEQEKQSTKAPSSTRSTDPRCAEKEERIESRERGAARVWLTAYKVIFALVLLANSSSLVTILASTGLTADECLTACSVNIFASVLIRQEPLLNLLYDTVTSAPTRLPLLVRRHLADFHHFGGLHTGCAVSALVWYIGYIVLAVEALIESLEQGRDKKLKCADMAVCVLFFLFLLAVCMAALPGFRRRWHNTFERTHRFAGWLSILTLWTHTILSALTAVSGGSMFHRAPVYLLTLTTLLLILPWLRIRRVKVHARTLSAREIMLTFDYSGMPHISTLRFSASPLVEWHAFATVPGPDSPGNTASVIVAAAGDWTRNLIAHPPSTLWIRNPPVRNFLAGVRMFESALIVATGAGIGPVMSFLYLELEARKHHTANNDRVRTARHQGQKNIKILWSAHAPRTNPEYAFVVSAICAVDPGARIVDTDAGRVDLVRAAAEVVQSGRLEAVFVVGNKRVTDLVVRGMNRWGTAAYGAVFDS